MFGNGPVFDYAGFIFVLLLSITIIIFVYYSQDKPLNQHACNDIYIYSTTNSLSRRTGATRFSSEGVGCQTDGAKSC